MDELCDFTTYLGMVLDPEKKVFRDETILSQLIYYTKDEENVQLLVNNHLYLLDDIISLIYDKKHGIKILGASTLVNISSFISGSKVLSNTYYNNEKICFVKQMLEKSVDPDCPISDKCSHILSNMTIDEEVACNLAEIVMEESNFLYIYLITEAITDENYNTLGCNLDYLSQVIANLTQSSMFRRFLHQNAETWFKRMLTIIGEESSLIVKSGIVKTVKNLCFDTDFHELLLCSKFDILPILLYPLIGPEEFDEEITEKLPPLLQHIPEDKIREPSEEIRTIILEALMQLCATKEGRSYMRLKGTYHVLRFYYMWETAILNLSLCENVIGLLIRTEEEINCENLKKLEIPKELSTKFSGKDTNLEN